MPMIPILRYPDMIGNRYSRSSSDVSIDNSLRLEGVLSLGVHRKLTRGKSWGKRAKPQTRTRGKYEPDAKMKLFLEDYNLLLNFVEAKGLALGMGAFEVPFTLTCTLFERQLRTTRWDILGACISDETGDMIPEGDDKNIEVDLALDVMDILRDGKSVVNENTPLGQIGSNI